MLFTKKLTNNHAARAALAARDADRLAFCNDDIRHIPSMMTNMSSSNQAVRTNSGIVSPQLWEAMDVEIVENFRNDQGDAYLNDLMPLSKSVQLGKTVNKYQRRSDAGLVVVSMSGHTGPNMDSVTYSSDGTPVPIYQTGWQRDFRELAQHRGEGYDTLSDDQTEVTYTLRERVADDFLDGQRDKDGNYIVIDGFSWQGMRNDARVEQVDLGVGDVNFNFTLSSHEYTDIEPKFKEVVNKLWLDNNCSKQLTVYISREMMDNFDRESSEATGHGKIIDRLARVNGVAQIKETSKLSGNQMMMFPLSGDVRPVVGMPFNVVAMPRPIYRSPYQFELWGAMGWQVKNTLTDQTCTLYAAS